MCPVCVMTALVFGPGLVAACGINWLTKLRGKDGDKDAAGALTLGLSGGESGAVEGEREKAA